MSATSYGTNIAFIEELYTRYQLDPNSVSESWREFFQDYEPQPEAENLDAALEIEAPVTAVPESPAPAAPAVPAKAPQVAVREGQTVAPLRGSASRIVQNMEMSLTLPTATSLRVIPVKALEENRRIINNHLAVLGQSKSSYTHLIAWAIVRALRDFPRMNSYFAIVEGEPARVDRDDVNFGVAIDIEKKDGTRTLLVPNIKRAQSLDFASFLRAYNDLIRKGRNNQLEIADFEGTTISLTNPGTLGTISSIPRLMQTQGTILATGQIDYPAEYSASDPSVLSELGISKVMTMTSTYDHRIIQGAESGAFLARVHQLLLGDDNFYDDVYRDLRIPYEPFRWSRDRKRTSFDGTQSDENVRREAAVLQLINAYRVRGHLIADLDPLDYKVGHHPELNPQYYGLTIWDLDREFITGGLGGKQTAALREILDILRETYCGRIGPEFMFIQDPQQKRWLQERMEPARNAVPLDGATKRRVLRKLNDAEAFEKFLHTKYVGHKRFSLEGAETLIPLLDHLFNEASHDGVEEVVIGMAHRGRLNVLANILGKSYEAIFNEFEGNIDPASTQGSGDVKYHLGAEGEHVAPDGSTMRLRLASNPSHLETVNPIVEGMVRAKQKLTDDRTRSFTIPVLLHGDAAFAGQGVVAETLNFSQLKGYRTGGTIHVVINNQIGFTTGPEYARSSVYATDVAKMVQAPIFHANGDDPEACIRAITLAYEFRQQFHKDVVIDMICYRRHGHNEADDPSLTQPKMYKLIKDHRSVRKLYTESLLRKGDLGPEEAEQWLDDFRKVLQEAFDRVKQAETPPPSDRDPLWSDEEITGYQHEPSPDTSVTMDAIVTVGEALVSTPEGFTVHPRLRPILERRKAMLEGREAIDWAWGELLAFGTLMLEGYRVRLSGQDSGRGTFSQRHALFFDHATGIGYVPLNRLSNERPRVGDEQLDEPLVATDESRIKPRKGESVTFSVYDSLLSEYGVLGFEYGYAVADPGALVMWEAQFGDFMNGAQIIIDQFISSAEEKWGQHSGIAMLLPHGYEGQGPEHSSARLERFLTLCAEGNMQVVYPTTPAQQFHLLRRQMRLEPRKPLIVMTPKSLLRLPAAASRLEDLTSGRFEPVLDDPSATVSPESVKRVVLTTGKLYYDLKAARDEAKRNDVALVRLEQFYPWPHAMLQAVLDRYANASEVVWAQEEPKNMGAYRFVLGRIGRPLPYIGRPISASPATGSHHRHEEQQKAIVDRALSGGTE
ncbi:MAG: multifunctional oxoglutarate decarboxylase/oxoglutarate dehydrogenase thiamine pyrophosphate-binding subunit/dihydrolipoyllysine-residue succinyltransferase subunit [Thermoanaerobaculia bacterium]